MLATKDENGYVRGNAASLARLANVSLGSAKEAIEKFQLPDPESNTPDNDGRRIQAVPGGWFVLNHALYRGKDYREYEAERKKEYRKKHSLSGTRPGHVPDASASASASGSVSDGDGVQGKGKPPSLLRPQPQPPSIPDIVLQDSLPPPISHDEAMAYADRIGMRLADAEACFDHFQSTDWQNEKIKDKPVRLSRDAAFAKMRRWKVRQARIDATDAAKRPASVSVAHEVKDYGESDTGGEI